MNSRDLSKRLDELATILESTSKEYLVLEVADELRRLSNEKYAPGNSVTWADLKPKSVNKKFTDRSGRDLPF